MIIVFLNNKLITCDTIVPFLFEVKRKQTNQVIELFCFNEGTYNAIMQNNFSRRYKWFWHSSTFWKQNQ